MASDDSWDAPLLEIERGEQVLNPGQQARLIKMTTVLQDYRNLQQVAEIKQHCNTVGDDFSHAMARELFSEFTDEEQRDLWVAPKFGGVFTTYERNVLKNLIKQDESE